MHSIGIKLEKYWYWFWDTVSIVILTLHYISFPAVYNMTTFEKFGPMCRGSKGGGGGWWRYAHTFGRDIAAYNDNYDPKIGETS